MKELSIEEKARAYDEAIKRAKEWYSDAQIGIGFKANLEKLFSELKESEDERIRKALLNWFLQFKQNDMFNDDISFKDILAWLEKQGEQKSAEWSEEDEDMLLDIDACIVKLPIFFEKMEVYGKDVLTSDFIPKARKFLKSLKDRCLPQPKQEWSDEDAEMLETCISLMSCNDAAEEETKWLKSLRPQNRWKPDSSMLICLEYAIKHINKNGDKRILSKLLEQLRKLREE